VILSVVLSAAVSFFITAVILRASRKRDLAAEAAGAEDALVTAVAQNAANKGRESRVGDLLGTGTGTGTATASKIQSIVFACDAGMGSSAMGATVLRNKIKKAGIEGVTVVNKAIANLTDDVDIVITQEQLTERAKQKTPSAEHYSVDNFMSSSKYDEVVAEVQARNS
jgi:PTS system mannitol-specific IIC component